MRQTPKQLSLHAICLSYGFRTLFSAKSLLTCCILIPANLACSSSTATSSACLCLLPCQAHRHDPDCVRRFVQVPVHVAQSSQWQAPSEGQPSFGQAAADLGVHVIGTNPLGGGMPQRSDRLIAALDEVEQLKPVHSTSSKLVQVLCEVARCVVLGGIRSTFVCGLSTCARGVVRSTCACRIAVPVSPACWVL